MLDISAFQRGIQVARAPRGKRIERIAPAFALLAFPLVGCRALRSHVKEASNQLVALPRTTKISRQGPPMASRSG